MMAGPQRISWRRSLARDNQVSDDRMTDQVELEPRTLLLTGAPGVGKTTVIRRLATCLAGKQLGGFFTEEIREGGERKGFRLSGFAGPPRSSPILTSRVVTASVNMVSTSLPSMRRRRCSILRRWQMSTSWTRSARWNVSPNALSSPCGGFCGAGYLWWPPSRCAALGS